ncbi:unnamed protein product [Trichogramma brassicae]|uniref:Large ribosomal subunit protein uL18m n=1 Tax=Trichogramma brassicae TaxID=86971 RepID=A0A6H5IW16_9HYME|nr:unnamed protein product [Trichogramma brassicae]
MMMNGLRLTATGSSIAAKSLTGNIVVASRQVRSNAAVLERCTEIRNRNPRNLELMTIARKPQGYHLDNKGHEFWNKLFVRVSARHFDAEIVHYKHGPTITVSTRDWALKKQLYKTNDISAYSNVGRVLAQKCLEAGITSVYCDIDEESSQKFAAFIAEMKKGGVALEEPPQYTHAYPWDAKRMVKPWTLEN